MATDIARIDPKDAQLAAHAATTGDLANLSPEQRTALYGSVCSSMGLNPLSRPFEYIRLNNKLTLYATRTATDQLRKINGVSITSIDQVIDDGVLIVTVKAQDASGRTDMEIGAVTVAGLKGEALANARMKAITKAKRRVTLSISGLGWMDESEVSSVPSAVPVNVDQVTGEIHAMNPEGLRVPLSSYSADEVMTGIDRNGNDIGDMVDRAERSRRPLRAVPEPEIESPVDVLRDVAAKHDILPESLADWAYDKYEAQSVDDAPPRAIAALIAALQNEKERARFVDTYPPVGVIDGDAS